MLPTSLHPLWPRAKAGFQPVGEKAKKLQDDWVWAPEMDFTTAENRRLAALRDLDVLDTPREAEFDDLVMLASRICGAPVSLVSFVDEDRQ